MCEAWGSALCRRTCAASSPSATPQTRLSRSVCGSIGESVMHTKGLSSSPDALLLLYELRPWVGRRHDALAAVISCTIHSCFHRLVHRLAGAWYVARGTARGVALGRRLSSYPYAWYS